MAEFSEFLKKTEAELTSARESAKTKEQVKAAAAARLLNWTNKAWKELFSTMKALSSGSELDGRVFASAPTGGSILLGETSVTLLIKSGEYKAIFRTGMQETRNTDVLLTPLDEEGNLGWRALGSGRSDLLSTEQLAETLLLKLVTVYKENQIALLSQQP
jgi:hypothetical protein